MRSAASGPPASLADARHARIKRLALVDAALAAGDPALSLLYERAQVCNALGATEAARLAFLAVLERDTTHAGALNELGRLLNATGFSAAARSLFMRAVECHPGDPTGHGNLATLLLDTGDLPTARRHFEIAVRLDPENVGANACLAIVHLRLGDVERAKAYAAVGFRGGALGWPYRGSGDPIRVLVINSALGGNVATEQYLDDRVFAKWTLVAEFSDPLQPLPPHELVFNAVGDADRCGIALDATEALLAQTTVPTINSARRVRATGRHANARRLTDIPDLVVPLTAQRFRAQLSAGDAQTDLSEAGFTFPLILRSPGYHTGDHCVLVERCADLRAAVAALPGDALLVIAYVHVRGVDALVRKYRVMFVGDALYPLHLAISTGWKVHYFSADMTDSADHRAEEAAFLADMPGVLGPAAMTALHAIRERLGLDYGGVDFGLDARGRVVVFEANATMVVPPPPPDERWDYRREPVRRIHAAVRAMVCERAKRTTAR